MRTNIILCYADGEPDEFSKIEFPYSAVAERMFCKRLFLRIK